MSKDLLVEIGVEEIPAGQLKAASEQFAAGIKKALDDAKIEAGALEIFATPRRIGVLFKSVSEGQKESAVEMMGPPKRIAYDGEGKPTQAALGFAKTNGVDISEVKIKTLPKGEYLCVMKVEKGRKTEELLPEMITRQIAAINWAKTMKWSGDARFVRPIRSLLCLFGRNPVKVEYSDVVSSNKVFGHRILSPNPAVVSEPGKYKDILKELSVTASFEERKAQVLEEVKNALAGVPGRALLDEDLVEEITNLVEIPSGILGTFDKKYLELPGELLIEVMKKNQKYFPVLDSSGKLLPYFVCIRNGSKLHNEIVKEGNERVLRARFEDAAFFFNEDKKTRLCDRVVKLKNVVFQVELGSLHEKIERLKALYGKTAASFPGSNATKVNRALELCKTDLVTDMIREFPELQGIMGREYAKVDGEDAEVSSAIAEHYLPKFSGDALPQTVTGRVLSLLDRIDTISGCFAIGLVPTGSQDPYGLRRSTLGVIAQILRFNLALSVKELVLFSLETYAGKVKGDSLKIQNDILEFFKGRMDVILREKGLRYDIVNAVLATDCSNISEAFKRAEVLDGLAKAEGFNNTMVTFSRVINIIPKGGKFSAARSELFKDASEKSLFEAAKGIEKEFEGLLSVSKFSEAFKLLTGLTGKIDGFFTGVMVMDKDPEIKENRLALLALISAMFLKLGDFSKINTK